jgi:hypothetical protein
VITSSSTASSIGAKTIYRHNLNSYSTHMWSTSRREWGSIQGSTAWWVLYAKP